MAAACSPDCRYYAAISDDGRLRVWSTETNVLLQEYTPDLHLSAPPVCLTWVTLGTGNATKKAKKRKSSGPEIQPQEQELSYIALGTASGKLLLYSIAQAKVETVLESKKQNLKTHSVTCLDWDRDYGLYSATSGNSLLEWDIQSASVKNKYDCNADYKNKNADKITAIKIVPNSTNKQTLAVTASCRLRLWSLQPFRLLRTMLGHSGAVSALALATFDKCLVASCTKTERLLSFWDITVSKADLAVQNGDTKQKKSEPVVSPAYNFVMEDAPTAFDLSVQRDGGDRIDMAVVTRSGVVHYYSHTLNGSSGKPIKPSVTLHVSTEEAAPLPLVCGALERDQLVVGYHVGGRLCFERVTPSTKNKTQVLIRAGPPARDNKRRSSGAEETPSVTYVQPAAALKRPANSSKVEVPMESRLANLELGDARRGSVHQNLTKLLQQGLHSGDREMLAVVLSRTDPAVAARTVSALPSRYAPLLMDRLADMATGRTNQCESVCVWLAAALRCHSSALLAALTSSDASDRLGRLTAAIAQRRSHLCQLLSLKGRLELMAAQRSKRSDELTEMEAVIDYIDTSSESEEDLQMELAAVEDTDSGSLREESDTEQE